jgi:hypothetical protein
MVLPPYSWGIYFIYFYPQCDNKKMTNNKKNVDQKGKTMVRHALIQIATFGE